MKKSKRILLTVLSVITALCFALGVGTACSKDKPSIKVKSDILKYFVHDSIYVFDLFEYEEGYNYSFSFTYGENEPVEIKGESFFAEVTGEYVVKGVAEKDGKTAEDTVTVTVVDEVPVLILANMEAQADLFASYLPSRLINGFAVPTVLSDGVHKEYISQIAVYKDGNDKEPTVYKIEGAEASADGFWDGRKINFIYECKHVVTIVSETSGGKSFADLVIKVAENLDDYKDLTEDGYNINYDKVNGIISWDAIPETDYYRVKYGGKTLEQKATSVNLNEILTGEFHYFNMVVIPVNEDGEFMGKLVSETVHLTPEGLEGVVLGNGVISIDSATREVELSGKQSSSPGWKSGVRHMENSYIAFAGEYGVNTKVEFTFTGNNLPQVGFFVDNMNGNMTNEGGKGIMLMNGLFTAGDNTQSSSTTEVVGEHNLIYLGPDRMGDYWPVNNYISAAQLSSKKLTITENTLFTQKALREDVTGRTYRYTVVCYESSGYVAFLVKLTDQATGEVVSGPFTKVTDIALGSVTPGHIVAWAGVKGEYNNTKFSFDLPKVVDGDELYGRAEKTITDNPDGTKTVEMSPGFVKALGATWGQTGTIRGQGYVSNLQDYAHNYVTLGEYGVGYEFVTTFTGNNMPMIMAFANNVNASLSSGVTIGNEAINKGYVITNGITLQMSSQTAPFIYSENVLTARGPDRINYHIGYAASNTPEPANGTFVSNKEGEFGAFEDGKNYKFVLGTKEVNSFVIMYAEVYDITATETLVFKGEMETGLTKAEIEAMGKNVLLMAGVRGVGVGTTFTYNPNPQLKYPTNIEEKPVTVTDNKDGSYAVVMKPGQGGVSVNGIMSFVDIGSRTTYVNNYLEIGEYGVGYKFVTTFRGNNMPQIMLFSNTVNAQMAAGYNNGSDVGIQGQTGYLLLNGWCARSGWAGTTGPIWQDFLSMYGPNRMGGIENNYNNTTVLPPTTTNLTALSGDVLSTASTALSNDITYRYTVSTSVVGGLVRISILLENAETDAAIFSGYYDTGKTQTEIESQGKNVVFYAGVKGTDVNTTFTYYTPTNA